MDIFDTVSASEKGTWVHLINQETGQPAYARGEDGNEDMGKPVRIRVLGPDSPTYKRKAADRVAHNMKKHAGADLKKMSHAQIVGLIDRGAINRAEDAADATIDWENLPLPKELAKFSTENAAAVYTGYPQILAIVDAGRSNHADFFGEG